MQLSPASPRGIGKVGHLRVCLGVFVALGTLKSLEIDTILEEGAVMIGRHPWRSRDKLDYV